MYIFIFDWQLATLLHTFYRIIHVYFYHVYKMIDKSLITVELVIVASIVATWSIVSFQCRYLFCICKKLLAAWQVRYNHLNFSNFLGINYIYFLIGVGSAVRCFKFFVFSWGGNASDTSIFGGPAAWENCQPDLLVSVGFPHFPLFMFSLCVLI